MEKNLIALVSPHHIYKDVPIVVLWHDMRGQHALLCNSIMINKQRLLLLYRLFLKIKNSFVSIRIQFLLKYAVLQYTLKV